MSRCLITLHTVEVLNCWVDYDRRLYITNIYIYTIHFECELINNTFIYKWKIRIERKSIWMSSTLTKDREL